MDKERKTQTWDASFFIEALKDSGPEEPFMTPESRKAIQDYLNRYWSSRIKPSEAEGPE